MKQIPFKYGGVVESPYFIDREKELAELTLSLSGGSNLVLYSPRRYGKTSLIHKVSEQLEREGIVVVYFDFFQVNTREKFLESYMRAIFKKADRWEKMLQRISGLIRTARPFVTIDNEGKPVLSLGAVGTGQSLLFEDIVNLPEKLADKKRWVVVFDEFQEVENLNGESFEKEIRSCIQHHQQVNYILMGSKKHLLLEMVSHKNRAFYNFGKLVHLQKIPEDFWLPYMINGMNQLGFGLSEAHARRIIEASENIPYYVQYLASEVAECGLLSKKIDEETLLEAENRIMIHQDDFFRSLLESLSATQQQTLFALAKEGKEIFSRAFLEKNRLQTSSGVQRSVSVLMRKGIIDKIGEEYVIEDPFFRRWLLEWMKA
jgi:AAA+ ATPase superfamily predicted ATPase